MDRLVRKAHERGEPFRILIVDDEQWVRQVFNDFCELTSAFDIDLAQSGLEAIKMVQSKEYDLITLDIIMPEMSGLEALTEIKRFTPGVPIMIITGNATDKLVNEAGVIGASRVMYKPIRLEDFVSELSNTLTK